MSIAEAPTSLAETLVLLGDPKHLQREKGLKALSALLETGNAGPDATDHAAVEAGIEDLLAGAVWERKLGGLMGAKAYVVLAAPGAAFTERLRLAAMALLEDGEVRVRLAVGEVLKALAQRQGLAVYEACAPGVLDSITRSFDRTDDEGEEGEGDGGGEGRPAPMVPFTTESPACPGSPQPEPQEPLDPEAAPRPPPPQGVAQQAGGQPGGGQQQGAQPASPTGGDAGGSLVAALLQSSYRKVRVGRGELRHDTEGWKCLETSMRALQGLVEGVGPSIASRLDEPTRELLYRAVHHTNRFVRETAHLVLASVCCALRGPALQAAAGRVAELLADGMGDNWSQVRYAACVCTRSLLSWVGEEATRADAEAAAEAQAAAAGSAAAPDAEGAGAEEGEGMAQAGAGPGPQALPGAVEALLPVLLPPMCLNRYYVAEGVRRYAQGTWEAVFGRDGGGRAAVARHVGAVVRHYTAQARANNHAVREASCACIAELLEKVDRRAVSPHVPSLLAVLVLAMKDSSWPVRDAACTAAGRAVLAYPTEFRPLAPQVIPLWMDHLSDNIPALRANSAAALAKAVKAYGDEVIPLLAGALADMLPAARRQPAEASKYTGLTNETVFGVAAQKARDNDPEVHTDQLLFSCGSLLARFSTSSLIKSDGCMDHGFTRDREPWEVSDGAVHLMRELAGVAPRAVSEEHMELLVELATMRSFPAATRLREGLWHSLPAIGKGIGKPRLKRHLSALLGPIAQDMRCGNPLAEAAAGAAAAELRAWVGPNVFAGYVPPGTESVLAAGGAQELVLPRPPPLAGILRPFAAPTAGAPVLGLGAPGLGMGMSPPGVSGGAPAV
ncbi:hypothetical protein HYH03_013559 [Edaphochlamys debaryana]|uniref:TOG domain-containing protein n=1 Tax=Edaphochlamys debaryana TaxID=47281 RepID=A0A836BT83_9CHLO|nr:hypothetical protein HYH03_013559 [Edaphochlamys debaryana]|eukprot:KAG2487842.1 hypothetical protein HYH03_013559 [Edaphochlamys debaryana]